MCKRAITSCLKTKLTSDVSQACESTTTKSKIGHTTPSTKYKGFN